jgi:hypothetical protein
LRGGKLESAVYESKVDRLPVRDGYSHVHRSGKGDFITLLPQKSSENCENGSILVHEKNGGHLRFSDAVRTGSLLNHLAIPFQKSVEIVALGKL